MTSFMGRTVMLGDAHWEVQVFVGPDEHHRGLAGRLIMSPAEARQFLELINGQESKSAEHTRDA